MFSFWFIFSSAYILFRITISLFRVNKENEKIPNRFWSVLYVITLGLLLAFVALLVIGKTQLLPENILNGKINGAVPIYIGVAEVSILGFIFIFIDNN